MGEPAEARDPRWALAVAILGSSAAFIDQTVVNVALPVMQTELGIAVDDAQWIVEAYALLLASLVLVGGALGDRFGRRRIFAGGVALFAAASVGCAIAPSAAVLIGARALQGLGGAFLVPGSLALISASYTDREKRGAAIGTWSAASAITSAVGPVAGGWVVAHASWRWLFVFNVPLAAVIIALALRRVAESRDEAAHGAKLDVPGAALVTCGLGAVVYALLDAERAVSSTRLALLASAGVVTLAAFFVVEARSPSPMVPLALFRVRTFAGANLLTLLLYAALGGAFFFLPFDLIQVQRYSPAAAGAALLPFVALMSVLSRPAGAFAGKHGARLPLVVGPAIAAVAFALLAAPGRDASYLTGFFPGIVTMGVGMGITVAPLTDAVMGSVKSDHAGVASGINNAVARAAGLLAIAALGLLLVARFDASLDGAIAKMAPPPEALRVIDAERAKLAGAELAGLAPAARDAWRRAFDDAYVDGFRAVMLVSAALAALGAVAALVMVESRDRAGAERR